MTDFVITVHRDEFLFVKNAKLDCFGCKREGSKLGM
jgi:hypothetical protein